MLQNTFDTLRIRKKRPNKFSHHFTHGEKEILEKLLDSDIWVLASGTVQLLELNRGRKLWRTIDAGVACLVKDQKTKEYCVRLYSVQLQKQLWDLTLNGNLNVNMNEERLLTFESDGKAIVYGLNFNHIEEADAFKSALNKRYHPSKSHEDAEYWSIPASAGGVQHSNSFKTVRQNFMDGAAAAASAAAESVRKAADKLGYKKKIRPDIGSPTDFQHRVHVGWQPGAGFQSSHIAFDDLDPTIQEVLRLIGMSPTELDEGDKEFIYDFVDQFGGIGQLKEELAKVHVKEPIQYLPKGPKSNAWSTKGLQQGPSLTVPLAKSGRPTVPPPAPPISSIPNRPWSRESLPPPPSEPPPPPPLSARSIIGSMNINRVSKLKEFYETTGTTHSIRNGDEKAKIDKRPEELNGITGALARALAERRKRMESDGNSSVGTYDSDDD